MVTPEDVLAFWLDEVGPQGWYAGGDALDQTCRDRFEGAWQHAIEGGYGLWLTHPSGALAYLILMDQLPRNMFRGQGKSYASDPHALAAAKAAIFRGWDMRIDEPARQFFYMPLMHAETLTDQERAVRLIMTRMPQTGASNLHHARAHREVIRMFGRFPTRNTAMDRPSTTQESDFVQGTGYSGVLESLSA